jgi:Kef-type K+ transport system membrane component KefB
MVGDEPAVAIMMLGLILLGAGIGSQLARAARLPSITGQLVAGMAIGVTCAAMFGSAVELLALARQVAGATLLFWIGTQMTAGRMWQRRRLLLQLLAPVVASVVACVVALAFVLDAYGHLTRSEVAVLALALSTTSPTVVALVARETAPTMPLARVAIDACVLANIVIAASVLALTANTRGPTLRAVEDVSVGALAGCGLAVVGLVCRRGGAWLIVIALVAIVAARQHVVHADLAILAGALVAGSVLAHRSPLAATVEARLGSAIPLAGATLFAIAGALVEPDALTLIAPAAVLCSVRGFAMWWGARVAGALRRERAVDGSACPPVLPQAGSSIVVLGLAGGELGAPPMISLVLVVVILDLLVSPLVLRGALSQARRSPVPRSWLVHMRGSRARRDEHAR